MARLLASGPFIDVHRELVRATPDAVWTALIRGLGGSGETVVARLLGCDPGTRSPDFAGRVGQSVPGFEVVESEPGHRLGLAGRHRSRSTR